MRESLLTLPMSNLRWTIKGCLKAADFFYFHVKLSIKDQSIFIYILLCIFLNKIFLKLTRNFIFNIISILHVTSTITTPLTSLTVSRDRKSPYILCWSGVRNSQMIKSFLRVMVGILEGKVECQITNIYVDKWLTRSIMYCSTLV